MATPKQKLEGNRSWPFTIDRRNRCVKRIMKETGIGQYEAEIAYRIATCGLTGSREVEDKGDDGLDS